jgi:serine phosphatase RsbU (regulator of sigma subunit)/Tfp pilus assembly protein PilF
MKRTINTLLLIINIGLITASFAFCQSKNEIDSLLQALKNHPQEDTTKVRILGQLCWKNRNNDFVKAIDYGKQGAEIAQKINDFKGWAETLNFMGVVHRNMGDYVEASSRFYEALKMSEKHKIAIQIAYSNNNIGDILKFQKKYKESLPYAQKALKMFEDLGDKKGMGFAYVRLGETYQSLKQYEKSIEAFQKSLTIREQLGDKSSLITSYNRIGTVHALKKEYDQALIFYQKGLQFSEVLEDKRAMAGCLDNIAWVYIRLKDYATAQTYASRSLAIAQSIDAKVDEKNAYLTLSKLSEYQGNISDAYTFHKKFEQLKDTIDNIEKASQLSKMQAIYETNKKAQENKFLKQENDLHEKNVAQKNLILLSVSVALTLSIIIVSLVFVSRQRQLKLNNTIKRQNEVLMTLSKDPNIQIGHWEETVALIVKTLTQTLNIERGSVWRFYKEEQTWIECIGLYETETHSFSQGDILYAEDFPAYFEAIENEKIIVAKDALTHPSTFEFKEAYLMPLEIKSMLDVPIFSRTGLWGVICCEAKYQKKRWKNHEISFAKSVSDILTIGYKAYGRKTAEDELQKQYVILGQQKEEIATQRDNLIELNETISKKNDEITSSINYSKRIQSAILPLEEQISPYLPEFFILYQPRDIVSGDFYWFEQKDGKSILAAVDCTGHGVPGALMSMMGNEILNEIVNHSNIVEADQILNELHKGIRYALKQDTSKNSDGMDIALVVIDHQNKKMEYAGAKNPLYFIQNGELSKIKADISSIGGHPLASNRGFTKHIIDISIPTTFYIFSDGYQDQFGGENYRKFMVKSFRDLLFEIHKEKVTVQKEILENTLNAWMSQCNAKQTDDILVIGVRV